MNKIPATLLLVLALAPALGVAQTAEDQARIDYAAAKRALQQGKHDVALAKLEAVMNVLGEQPELLALAAECAVALKDTEKASEYVKKAFAAADAKFRTTPAFERLVNVAADLEIAKEGKAPKVSRWKKPYDSLCSMEFFPISPTYMRRGRFSSTGEFASFSETRQTVSSLTGNSVTLKTEFLSSSDGASIGKVLESTSSCDDKGTLHHAFDSAGTASGYDLLTVIEEGKSSWSFSDSGSRSIGSEVWSTIFSETCSVRQLEPIAVAGGSFEAVRVECSGTISSHGGESQSLSVITEARWYARGVGLVKESGRTIRDSQYGDHPAEHHTSEQSYELLEWKP